MLPEVLGPAHRICPAYCLLCSDVRGVLRISPGTSTEIWVFLVEVSLGDDTDFDGRAGCQKTETGNIFSVEGRALAKLEKSTGQHSGSCL